MAIIAAPPPLPPPGGGRGRGRGRGRPPKDNDPIPAYLQGRSPRRCRNYRAQKANSDFIAKTSPRCRMCQEIYRRAQADIRQAARQAALDTPQIPIALLSALIQLAGGVPFRPRIASVTSRVSTPGHPFRRGRNPDDLPDIANARRERDVIQRDYRSRYRGGEDHFSILFIETLKRKQGALDNDPENPLP